MEGDIGETIRTIKGEISDLQILVMQDSSNINHT